MSGTHKHDFPTFPNVIAFTWDGVEHVRDLEYFDGLILGEFKDAKGSLLVKWMTLSRTPYSSEVRNRWLVWRPAAGAIEEYLANKLTFLSLIERGAEHTIVDGQIGGEVLAAYSVLFVDLPESYLPEANCMHDPSLREGE